VAKVRDSQRSAVYRWERSLDTTMHAEQMTLEQCRDLIGKVWKRYAYGRMPNVADGRGTRKAYGSKSRISLPRWSRNPTVVLHETAHALVQLHLGNAVAGHGPEFARVFLGLLEEYMDVCGSKAHRKGVLQEPRKVRFSYRDYLKEFREKALKRRKAQERIDARFGEREARWRKTLNI
jgi:hypothetical protein